MSISKLWVRNDYVASGTSLTSATFDSTGYTHIVVFTKHQTTAATQTVSDNKSTTGWTSLTQAVAGANVYGQLHYAEIGSPGTNHTVTFTASTSVEWLNVNIWLVNATTGMVLANATTSLAWANGSDTSGTRVDGGSLTTDRESVSFMGVGEAGGQNYSNATSGWTFDKSNNPGALSRYDATSGTFDPACDQQFSNQWVVCSASFGEPSAFAIAPLALTQFRLRR